MIKGIAHAAYVVKDMEKSLNFYCNILGFKKVFGFKDDNGNPWIEYVKINDGQFIELFYGTPEKAKNLSYSHLCFEVDDINEIADRLRAFGIPLDIEINQGGDLNYQCWASDPDGNKIEFMQMHPQSPQNTCK